VGDQEQRDRKQNSPYFDDSLLINSRLSEVERQQREDKAEQRKHERSQRQTNWLITIFTGLLFVTSLASDLLMLRYVALTRESADAAKNVADTSAKTLATAYRPRVIVQSPYPRDSLDTGRLAMGFKVINYGLIAARNIRFYEFENISPLSRIAKLDYRPANPLAGYPKTLIPSTEPTEFAIYGQKVLSPDETTAISRMDELPINPDRMVATLSVLMEYEDEFSTTPHHTEGCAVFTLKPHMWWINCPWPTQLD
jgi:hypothetical protein